MSDNPTNPYAPIPIPLRTETPIQIDDPTHTKIKAIIKDADQFWLAILLCLLCSGIGSIVIGVWYLVRLLQWNSMSQAQPLLMVANPTPGSIAAKFQGAKIKLIAGFAFGILMLLLVFAYIAIVIFSGIAMQPQR